MFTPAALSAFGCRHAEAVTAHFFLPFEIGRLVMGSRIPNEIQAEQMSEVITLGIPSQPRISLFSRQHLQYGTWVALLVDVAGNQVACALDDFESCLHAHRALG